MQAAPALRDSVVQLIDAIWYAAVQWVGAAVVFAAADWRLLLPLLLWLVAYAGTLFHFVPRIKERSTAAAEARSMLVGRIVDSYTNILTVKLFAHADLRPEAVLGHPGDVLAVDQDAPALHVVEAQQEIDQRRLAGS